MDGILNIFKNKGMTSFDVVRIVRKISKIKKVGHTGTLDPDATGVLPVCIGKATKIIDYIMEEQKSYYVKFKLGIITSTYDLEGEVIEEKDCSHVLEDMVLEAINNFKGEYMQIPPMYSALKKDGVRLYTLARQGIEIEREGRRVNILDISNINISIPYVSMDVTCSKGTYIRSLCYDIGDYLKVGATVTELSRTKTATFTQEESINITDLNEDNILSNLISIEEALQKYPKMKVNEGYSKLLINGVRVGDRRLTSDNLELDKIYRVYDENSNFVGLGKRDKQGFKIEKLLV
jgi:tRNA pseudouridine55 synthase